MDNLQKVQYFLEEANRAARSKDWSVLAERTLALVQEASQAEAAVLYPPAPPEENLALGAQPAADAARHLSGKKTNSLSEENSSLWRGTPKGLSATWWKALRNKFAEPELFQCENPRWFERSTSITEPFLQQAFANLSQLQNLLVLPLKYSRGEPGWIVLVNASIASLDVAAMITDRLATDLEKAAELTAARRRETRLMALNDILGQLGANLNPDQVLRIFIERARQFLQVEAVSLFLVDENNGELVLQIASQADTAVKVEKIRVPLGVGIIGRVVQTGETLLVEDVQNDHRHYQQVDQHSGFRTQSILAVPLRARSIDLGQGRGTSRERIIGGLEAINKIGGGFRAEDIELLQILAKGASTVLVVAQLYLDANTMFADVIQAMVTAIDAKDPYTVGHSQRVSDYSAEIARELGLPDDEIYHIRMGSLFHGVSQVNIPESLLRKTGALVSKAPQTEAALQGSQSPLLNRIIAVADVFDAMTSDRAYSLGMSVEAVFDHLRQNAGTQFDPQCVVALIRAYEEGRIQTQSERLARNAQDP